MISMQQRLYRHYPTPSNDRCKYWFYQYEHIISKACNFSSTNSHHEPSNKNNNTSLLINLQHAPDHFDPKSVVVYDNIITPTEGSTLQNDILQYMKRKRRKFEKGHWDSVITNYKEIELPFLSSQLAIGESGSNPTTTFAGHNSYNSLQILSNESYTIIEKIRKHLEQTHFAQSKSNNRDNSSTKWLPPHAIYLKQNGILSAHVDSVKFSGRIVAGLSLLSTSIMRLKPASPTEITTTSTSTSTSTHSSPSVVSEKGHEELNVEGQSKSLDGVGFVDLLLPPLSLYVLSDMSRFEYTHELLESGHKFTDHHGNSTQVDRNDRLSVIFRDAKIM